MPERSRSAAPVLSSCSPVMDTSDREPPARVRVPRRRHHRARLRLAQERGRHSVPLRAWAPAHLRGISLSTKGRRFCLRGRRKRATRRRSKWPSGSWSAGSSPASATRPSSRSPRSTGASPSCSLVLLTCADRGLVQRYVLATHRERLRSAHGICLHGTIRDAR